jgi:hypothetical protein
MPLIQVIFAAMFIAFLIMVIGNGLYRRSQMTPAQKAKEDAKPFDDAW